MATLHSAHVCYGSGPTVLANAKNGATSITDAFMVEKAFFTKARFGGTKSLGPVPGLLFC
jgi:hypothetical protein